MKPHTVTYLLVRHIARFAVLLTGLLLAMTIIYGAARFHPGPLIVVALIALITTPIAINDWRAWRHRDHT